MVAFSQLIILFLVAVPWALTVLTMERFAVQITRRAAGVRAAVRATFAATGAVVHHHLIAETVTVVRRTELVDRATAASRVMSAASTHRPSTAVQPELHAATIIAVRQIHTSVAPTILVVQLELSNVVIIAVPLVKVALTINTTL